MLNLNIWNVAFTVINLLVLYLFMKHFLIGPVRSILDERKQMIEHDLDEAKNRETEARQMKEQYQASIGNADEEASRIIEEARNRAAAEYEKVLAQARAADAAKKMEEADRTIALEREKAMNDLKAGVAGLAMTAAAKLISEQSAPDSDRNLYNRFLAESGEGND